MKSLPLQVVKSLFGDYCFFLHQQFFRVRKRNARKNINLLTFANYLLFFFCMGLEFLCVKAVFYANWFCFLLNSLWQGLNEILRNQLTDMNLN